MLLLCPAQLVRSSSMRSRKARASRPLDPAVQSVFHRAFNLEFSRETGTLTLVVVLVPWLPMASWAAASRNSPRPSKTVSASGPRALLMGRSHSGRQPVRRVFRCPCLRWRQSSSRWPCPRRRPPRPLEIRAQKGAPGVSVPLHSLSFFSPQRCYPGLRRRGWAARHLIGLGPGLTPAGDDFLGGYLAGRFAQSPGGSRDSGVLFFSLSFFPTLGKPAFRSGLSSEGACRKFFGIHRRPGESCCHRGELK